MANYVVSDTNLQSVADEIRAKGGTVEQLSFPTGFNTAIRNIQTSTPLHTETWEQMPTKAKAFIDYITEHPYDDNDYLTTKITDYAVSATADASDYKPVAKEISGTSGTMHINNYTKSLSNLKFSVDGIIPNSNTLYYVENNNSVSDLGKLNPSGKVRYINTPAINVRDLGGWNCDGGTVKYGKLFRGGLISSNDRQSLVNECDVKHVIDLRSETSGNCCLGSDISITHTASYNWYNLVDHNGSIATWQLVLGAIFENVSRNKPIYFHCHSGADRTGTLAFVLEILLGMSQSDASADFELTSFSTLVENGTNRRRNNDRELSQLVSIINGLEQGVSFQQKVINWVVGTLGFSIQQINYFRRAMIDGNPQDVSVTTYANISKTLTNCQISGTDAGLIRKSYGSTYSVTITADTNYTLIGANITLTMNGASAMQYYNDGVISIPNITGDIVLNVEAVPDSGRIPAAYQEVKWVGFDGASWISISGVELTAYMKIAMELEVTAVKSSFVDGFVYSGNAQSHRISGRSAYIASMFNDNLHTDKDSLETGKKYSVISTRDQNSNNVVTFKVEKEGVSIKDDFIAASRTYTVGTTVSYRIGGYTNIETKDPMSVPEMKVYSYSIYTSSNSSDTLSYEFVPCYHKTNQTIGFYETVKKVFYSNSGTGTFTKGDDVN